MADRPVLQRINVFVDLDTDSFMDALEFVSDEQILEFVKQVDESVGDWDFTKACYEYFKTQYDSLPSEFKERTDGGGNKEEG